MYSSPCVTTPPLRYRSGTMREEGWRGENRVGVTEKRKKGPAYGGKKSIRDYRETRKKKERKREKVQDRQANRETDR